MRSLSSILCLSIILPVVLAGMFHVMILPPTSYYPFYSANLFVPVTLFCSALSHVWVFGIMGQRNIARPLPSPPQPQEQSRPVAIVTGSNTGIGWQTARTLVADFGYEVILACRNRDKALVAQQEILHHQDSDSAGTAVVLDAPLDLSSFSSVRAFVQEVLERYPDGISLLINNAGRNTSGPSEAHPHLDLLFQSNFLGHFLLTRLLLQQSSFRQPDARIVHVSSVMHHFANTDNVQDDAYWRSRALVPTDGGVRPPDTYAASKLAAILVAHELNRRRHPNVLNIAVNPGAVASDIWRTYPGWKRTLFRAVYLTPSQGSRPLVAAAVLDKKELMAQTSTVPYLQPYWLPFHFLTELIPPFPPLEMIGPYVGYLVTVPRLPSAGEDLDAASKALWDVSNELTGLTSVGTTA